MSTYAIVLFLHFLGLIGLFVGYGLEWVASALLRRATTTQQARSWLRVYRVSLPISGPALLLLILTGGHLASMGIGFKQGWILASIIAIVVALFIGFVLILPRVRAIRGALPEGNVDLPAEALARLQAPVFVTLVRVRFLLALGIVYLMTAKTSLNTSLLILLGAMVVGVIVSIPSWSRPAAKYRARAVMQTKDEE
jgi:hypothetical protein